MKAINIAALIIFFMFIAVHSYSQDYMGEKKTAATPYEKQKPEDQTGLTSSQDASATQDDTQGSTQEAIPMQKQIKSRSICIGKDCRSRWPVLKCANYEGRPAGETGDEFCGQMNKACMAVSIGGGQSFFGECSVPASSVHTCRCCWNE